MGSMATDSPSKFNVVLIQMRPKPNDPAFNFAHASSQIRAAISSTSEPNRPRLVILPEYHLTGFDPSSPAFIPACQTSHPYVDKYAALAAELKVNICAGTIVLTPEPEDPDVVKYDADTNAGEDGGNKPTLLNRCYFFSEEGKTLGSYDKVNLWHPERDDLTGSMDFQRANTRDVSSDAAVNGKDTDTKKHHQPQAKEESLPSPHTVIQTSLGPIGLLVCWDLAFPEAFRSLVQQGAKIILVPTYWLSTDMMDEGLAINPDVERLFLENTLVARAFESTAAVIFCNAGGPKDEGFLGISQVAVPILGKVKGSFEDSEEGWRVVEVDMEVVELGERNYRIRQDLKRDDWHYGYTK